MKNHWSLTMLALLSGAALCAAPAEKCEHCPKCPKASEARPQNKGLRIEPPVYENAPAPEACPMPAKEATPEERAARKAMHQRRFEIMVLINAYKIMPEAQRAPLKEELTRRIQADLEVSLAGRKERIAKAEQELERLRKEIAEQEANKAQLVAKEMERLLAMQPPRPNGPRADRKDGAPELPPPDKAPKHE